MSNQFEPLPFNDELHEDLFKLMILASNGRRLSYFEGSEKEYKIKMFIGFRYWFQYEDRTIADVECEKWIRTWSLNNLISNNEGSIYLEREKSVYAKYKITFKFEDLK